MNLLEKIVQTVEKKGGKCLKIFKISEKMLNFLPKLKSGKKETSGLGNC